MHEKVSGIPKRIIHVYCPPAGAGPELPLLYRAAQACATLLHPGYELLLFDAEKMETFLRNEPAEHQELMRRFPYPIQRFDFFRYLAVYRLGGFYLDLDVILARDFSPLLSCGCVFPFEELTLNRFLWEQHRLDWELGNYAFGSEAGHPFLRAVIENCVRAQRDPAWLQPVLRRIPRPFRQRFLVVNSTGPGLVTRTWAENPALHKSVSVLFPEDVRDERCWHRFGHYGIHLMNASWRDREGPVYRRLARLWESWTGRCLRRECAALGARRPGEWISLFPR